MADITLTQARPFNLVGSQDNAPMFMVCAGIDVQFTGLKASIYEEFVQRMLSKLGANEITDDDMFVLADLLEVSKALRQAGGGW